MKLNKENKYQVKTGDIIKFYDNEQYYVLSVLHNGRSVNYTLQDINTKQIIYSFPSSKCYGAIWISTKEQEEKEKLLSSVESALEVEISEIELSLDEIIRTVENKYKDFSFDHTEKRYDSCVIAVFKRR